MSKEAILTYIKKWYYVEIDKRHNKTFIRLFDICDRKENISFSKNKNVVSIAESERTQIDFFWVYAWENIFNESIYHKKFDNVISDIKRIVLNPKTQEILHKCIDSVLPNTILFTPLKNFINEENDCKKNTRTY